MCTSKSTQKMCGLFRLNRECQFGFRKGRSTQQGIFELCKELNTSLNNDGVTGLLFLDISKAFYKLDYGLLMSKLRIIGVSNNSLKWF